MLSFALLDDSDSNDKQPTSRLYTDLQNVLSFNNSAQFLLMTEQMQDALRTGLYAVAVFSYELGVELQGLNVAEANLREFAAQPSFVLLYQQCQRLSPDEVTDWLREREDWSNNIAGIADLHASVNQEEFTQAIDRIQRYIVEGDIYQANYTFRFYFHTYGSIFSLYQSLRKRQPVPFGALISMPDGSAVLSLSPELFIHHSQGNLLTRPMKGTAAALVTTDDKLNEEINLQRCEQLSQDEKNRAENVMIVDLLRNDLGRIAQPGSIQVPKLFEVRRFNTVLQMTSSVTARSRNDLKLVDLLKAIYPCGSITGAPKIRAMQIINEVETEPRGIYTGAIGWFDPMHFQPDERNKIPEFCLSVPIRTLHLQAPISGGIRHGVMGVGAGIVLDSEAASEYQECLLKARFLTELTAQFSLFETMYATKEQGCRHWNRHLKRLTNSAHYFGFSLNLSEVERRVHMACAEFADNTPYRLKLNVYGGGQIQIQYAALVPIETPVNVLLATTSQPSTSIWLQHKTTQRSLYDQAWKTAESQGAFDMLFLNEQGELTEGGRSNLLVKIDGCWFTPPLSAGVLPGVMRSVLMDDPAWGVTEQSICVDQLKDAEEIALCNALRGVLPAQLGDKLLGQL